MGDEPERSTIAVERYIAAFEAWARVADEDRAVVASIAAVGAHLRALHRDRPVVEIEALCSEARAYLRARGLPEPDVGKSCLLGRMIYGGEELRTRACPIHEGHWSGCSPDPCPAGCNYGINVTGWLPNDLVDAWPLEPVDPELELLGEAVREGWSADHLAVYADRLIAGGDPRGELINLELAMGDAPTVEQRTRHAALVESCFGDVRSTAPDGMRSTRGIGGRAGVERGFLVLDLRETADVRKLYDARNGRFVRRVAVRGDGPSCRTMLTMLSIRRHAWLERITVVQDPVPRFDYAVSVAATRALFDNLPALAALEVSGRRVIAIDQLPVRWLWLSDLDAVSFEHAPRLATLVLGRIEGDVHALADELLRRAPALEAIHVPAAALAGISTSHPKVRVRPA